MTAHAVAPLLAAAAQAVKGELAALPNNEMFTDDEVESVYALAYQHAQSGRLQQALDFTSLAVVFRPGEVRYLKSAAWLLRQAGRHETAMNVYRVLDTIEPCNPEHVLGLAETALQLKLTERGQQLLRVIVEYSRTHGLTGPAVDRAQSLLTLMAKDEDHAH